jgi:hypothetical protein
MRKKIKEYVILIFFSFLFGIFLGLGIFLFQYMFLKKKFNNNISNTAYCLTLEDYYNKLKMNNYKNKIDKKTDIYLIKNFIKTNRKIFEQNCPDILLKTEQTINKKKKN